jgi:hypothetical protein
MDHLKRGFIFLMQAGRLARNTPSTLQPLAFLAGGGLAGALLISALMAVALARLGGAGAVLAGFLAALLLAALVLGGYLSAAEVTRRIFRSLAPGSAATAGPAWGMLRGRWLDFAAAAVASLTIGPARLILNEQAGSFLRAPWAQAVELIAPAMVVEGLGLKKGLERVSQIVGDNLLFIRPDQVAVGWAGLLAGLPLAAGGVVLGWGIERGIVLSPWALPHKPWAALVIGMLVACLCLLIAIAAAAYSAAAYRTCLFAWACEIEASRRAGRRELPDPPPSLAAALSGMESLTAPVYPVSNPQNEGSSHAA